MSTFKGRFAGTSPELFQFSESGSEKGTLQIIADLDLALGVTDWPQKPEEVALIFARAEKKRVQTFLFMSKDAMSYSFERLIRGGWRKGKALSESKTATMGDMIQALSDLQGIGDTIFDVNEVKEVYQGRERVRYEIVSGGRIVAEKPVDRTTFLARLGAIANTETGAGGGAPSGEKVPF